MHNVEKKFIQRSKEWICDGYSIDIRYVQRLDLEAPQLWEAMIGLSPLPPQTESNFRIETDLISVGQHQIARTTATEIANHLELAIQGCIRYESEVFRMADVRSHSFYSEGMHSESWYSTLNLQISGNRDSRPATPDMALLDASLRCAEPPFDGLADVCGWLGLNDRQLSGSGPSISIQILPPVDLLFERCALRDGRLTIAVRAIECFASSSLKVAVRGFPGKGISARRQVASELEWHSSPEGLKIGVVQLDAENMDSALIMLTLGDVTIRRQWLLDPEKSLNHRLLATQLFDKDLRMLKQAISQTSDATRFELGIAAVLFLLGFAPAVMLERDAPDLIVATPAGRLLLVECTTRIADFHQKLGKLIDRRGTISKALQASGHGHLIYGLLVCAQPRDQIAISEAELHKHQVLLVTADVLSKVLGQVRLPGDPDKLLEDGLGTIASIRT